VVVPLPATCAATLPAISRSMSVAESASLPSPARINTLERIAMVLRRSTTLCTCPKVRSNWARSMVSFMAFGVPFFGCPSRPSAWKDAP
jgi:hypothetical protein